MNDEQQIIEPVPTLAGYKKIPTFKLWIANQFPYIETDFDAITNYELLNAVIKYLNTIIENENNVESNVTALYNAFVNLHDYVENYFDNLDVQEEINNKLDKMVEDGTLESILLNYTKVTKVFDTYNDMMLDTSTYVNGMKLKTLGYYFINDDGGAEYVVTNVQSDTKYQVSIGTNLWIELILKDNINPLKLGAYGDGITDDSSYIQESVEIAEKNNLKVFCNKNHAISQTIQLNSAKLTFESIGSFILLGDIDAFKIHDVGGINLSIKSIEAKNQGNGVGLHILADENTISSLNVNINSIVNTKKGIVLESDNSKGIMYSKINWNGIYTTEHGILLKCGNIGTPYINENQFYGGRLSTAIGIEFIKGENQTDRFNGNKFFNFGLEGISNCGIKLNYTQKNIFENYRFSEGFTGSHSYSFNNSTEDVLKPQAARPGLSRNLIEFIGENKLIHIISPMRDGGTQISEEAIYHINGWLDLKPLYQQRFNYYNNSQIQSNCYNGMIIRIGVDDNRTIKITLPDIMSNDNTLAGSLSPYINYFFIETRYKGGIINIVDSNDNPIINGSDLVANSMYMCIRYTASGSTGWQLIKLQ